MKHLLLALSLSVSSAFAAAADGWIPLFNGKNLDGWKAAENPATFAVVDGQLVCKGPRAHLFYAGPVQNHVFKNFELQAEILTKPGANSGVYFHTEYQEKGWPNKGYEIQVNNSHKDPKRTAGVYAIKDNFAEVAKDNVWFTLRIRVEGQRIQTWVDGKLISDYTEEAKPERPKGMAGRLLSSGTIAIQGHDPLSEVHYRSIQIRPLP